MGTILARSLTRRMPVMQRSARRMGTAHKNASSWDIDSCHSKGRSSSSRQAWTLTGSAAAPYGTD